MRNIRNTKYWSHHINQCGILKRGWETNSESNVERWIRVDWLRMGYNEVSDHMEDREQLSTDREMCSYTDSAMTLEQRTWQGTLLVIMMTIDRDSNRRVDAAKIYGCSL
jgi:hypothetical protein